MLTSSRSKDVVCQRGEAHTKPSTLDFARILARVFPRIARNRRLFWPFPTRLPRIPPILAGFHFFKPNGIRREIVLTRWGLFSRDRMCYRVEIFFWNINKRRNWRLRFDICTYLGKLFKCINYVYSNIKRINFLRKKNFINQRFAVMFQRLYTVAYQLKLKVQYFPSGLKLGLHDVAFLRRIQRPRISITSTWRKRNRKVAGHVGQRSTVFDPLSSFLSARGPIRPSSLRAIESAYTRPNCSFRSSFCSLGRPVGKICSHFRLVEAAYTCPEIINLHSLLFLPFHVFFTYS